MQIIQVSGKTAVSKRFLTCSIMMSPQENSFGAVIYSISNNGLLYDKKRKTRSKSSGMGNFNVNVNLY